MLARNPLFERDGFHGGKCENGARIAIACKKSRKAMLGALCSLPLMSLFLPPLSEFTVQAASSLTGLVLLRFRAAPAAYGRSQFPG